MRNILIIAFLMINAFLFGQHLPLLGHYAYNGMLFNPAISGSREVFTATATYRKQWLNIDGSPNNQILSAHTPLKNEAMALGGFFFRDQIGVINRNALFLNYAYRIKLGSSTMDRKLSIGMAGGIVSENANWDELYLTDQVDMVYQEETSSAVNPNLSIGLYYSDQKSYISFSVPFLLQPVYQNSTGPEVEFDMSKLHYFLSSGYRIQLNDQFELEPSFLYRKKASVGQQLDATIFVKKKNVFEAGLAYRTNKTIIILAGIQLLPQLKMMYSYDVPLVKNELFGRSSHEISISYEFKKIVNSENPRFF